MIHNKNNHKAVLSNNNFNLLTKYGIPSLLYFLIDNKGEILDSKITDLLQHPLDTQQLTGKNITQLLPSEIATIIQKIIKDNEKDKELVNKIFQITVPVADEVYLVNCILQSDRRLVLILQNITSENITSQMNEIKNIINCVVSQSRDYQTGAPLILQKIAQIWGFDLAILWTIEPSSDHLIFNSYWSSPNKNCLSFIKKSQKIKIQIKNDVPGIAWKTVKSKFVSDYPSNHKYLRFQEANQANLHSLLAVPITTPNKVIGVMEYLSFKKRTINAEMMLSAKEIGELLGRIMQNNLFSVRENPALLRAGMNLSFRKTEKKSSILRVSDPNGIPGLLSPGDSLLIKTKKLYDQLKEERQTIGQLALTLKKDRDMLNIIMDNAKTDLAYLDQSFNYVEVNESYCRTRGLISDQLIGNNYFKIAPVQISNNKIKQVKKTGQEGFWHAKPFLNNNTKSKTVTYWDTRIIPVKDDSQEIQGYVLSSYDLTQEINDDLEREHLLSQIELEKEKAENEAEKAVHQANQLNAVLMAMSDPLTVLDMKGKFIKVNQAAIKLFGKDLTTKDIRTLTEQVKPKHSDNTLYTLEQLPCTKALNGLMTVSEIMTLTINRKMYTVLVSSSPIHINKRPIGAVISWHDISERERIEKQKDDFIAIASHELKTPLTTIKAFNQIIKQDLKLNSKSHINKYFQRMDSQLDKLNSLINELLDVSKIEAGKLDLKLVHFDLGQLLMEIVEDYQRLNSHYRINLLGINKLIVLADRDLISQVIINLLVNAIKYSPFDSQIVVRMIKQKLLAKVSVKDFGVGISPHDQDKIFERFYRVNGQSDAHYPGLGLGLYISKEIIRRHSGTINVISKPGKGSQFHFSLPLKNNT